MTWEQFFAILIVGAIIGTAGLYWARQERKELERKRAAAATDTESQPRR